MPAPFSGGCRCGAVRYDVSAEPTFSAHCYCRDCQYASGGACGTVIVVPRAAVDITGTVATYASTADSGSAVRRMFCATCGSPLFADNAMAPLLLVIRAASLDDPSWIRPQAHIWTDSAPPWASLDDGLPKFPRNPG